MCVWVWERKKQNKTWRHLYNCEVYKNTAMNIITFFKHFFFLASVETLLSAFSWNTVQTRWLTHGTMINNIRQAIYVLTNLLGSLTFTHSLGHRSLEKWVSIFPYFYAFLVWDLTVRLISLFIVNFSSHPNPCTLSCFQVRPTFCLSFHRNS